MYYQLSEMEGKTLMQIVFVEESFRQFVKEQLPQGFSQPSHPERGCFSRNWNGRIYLTTHMPSQMDWVDADVTSVEQVNLYVKNAIKEYREWQNKKYSSIINVVQGQWGPNY